MCSSDLQAWNHTFFWMGLTPNSTEPGGEVTRAVQAQFGSLENLKKRFVETAAGLFGSGWTWLVVNDSNQIDVVNTRNGDNPLCFNNSYPLWTCDIWEHAYYIDYRNQRKDYLEKIWSKVNWEFVAENLEAKRIPNMSRLMQSNGLSEEATTASFI